MAQVITIDGPSSSGKSSVGFNFAQKIGFKYIDSGAIYRVGCLKLLLKGINIDNKKKVVAIFKNLNLNFKNSKNGFRVFLDNQDVSSNLHDAQITQIVPKAAAYPRVREVVKRIQKRISKQRNTVMVGRDIGSSVFPTAKLKFFLTASPRVRTKRRFLQLKKKDPKITLKLVMEQMLQRDKMDAERKISPMVVPEGAIVVDTTNLTTEESVEELMKHYQKLIQNSKAKG